MAKNLKEILVNIARLPKGDQRWILRQLPQEHLITFHNNQGEELLKEAQRFRKLKTKHLPSLSESTPNLNAPDPLPSFCEELAKKAPLYAAVVIEQGGYPWESLFLQKFDNDGLIKNSLQNQVPDLKPVIKNTLFNEWEQSLSFESFMESENG